MLASLVLILGARSDIGRELARAYAAKGCEVILAARGDISADATDLALHTQAKVRAVRRQRHPLPDRAMNEAAMGSAPA